MHKRSSWQKVKDTLTFPVRAFTLFEKDRWTLSSLATERFDYVAREVRGKCLDIGCGKHNRFINKFLNHKGVGIDVYAYEGLTSKNIIEDMTHLPYKDGSFETVTFIANINHIPRPLRSKELAEAYRVLKPNGKIIVTMGNPVAEWLVHKIVYLYDRFLGTYVYRLEKIENTNTIFW